MEVGRRVDVAQLKEWLASARESSNLSVFSLYCCEMTKVLELAMLASRYETYLLRFDDADEGDILFCSEQAKELAWKTFQLKNENWNCHLFQKVAGPSDSEF